MADGVAVLLDFLADAAEVQVQVPAEILDPSTSFLVPTVVLDSKVRAVVILDLVLHHTTISNDGDEVTVLCYNDAGQVSVGIPIDGPIATAAYQTVFTAKGGGKWRDPAAGDKKKPRFLDTCHALASDSPVVKQYWPDFYKGADAAAEKDASKGS